MLSAVEAVQRKIVLQITESLVVGVVEIEASLWLERWIFEGIWQKAGVVAIGQLRSHTYATTTCCIRGRAGALEFSHVSTVATGVKFLRRWTCRIHRITLASELWALVEKCPVIVCTGDGECDRQ